MADRPLLSDVGPALFGTSFFVLLWGGLFGAFPAAVSGASVAAFLWWLLRHWGAASCLLKDCIAAYTPVDDHER